MSKHEKIKYVELLFNLLCFRTPPVSFQREVFSPELQLLKKPNSKPIFLNLKKILLSFQTFRS